MPNYAESIIIIAALLDKNEVPYSINKIWEGWQLRFPWTRGDVACHAHTYGNTTGHVETYEFPWDEGDVSMLKPEAAAEKIINYFKYGVKKYF